VRLLFVHAHPDDETLATGLTMAAHVRRGHEVHLLTCTLGEEGEIIPPELAHLAADRDDSLGPWRAEELRRAMAVLGAHHRVLGEDPAAGVRSRYRDSGMAGTPSADHPRAFVRADPAEAAGMVAAVITEVSPDVVVTYDRHGGYGHPDHIQTHRVTLAALAGLAGRPAGDRPGSPPVPTAYCILTPARWALEDRLWLAAHVDRQASPRMGLPDPAEEYPPSVVPEDVVTHEVVDPGSVPLQARALREHRTQVSVYDGYYALSNHVAARLPGREGFARIDPASGELFSGEDLAAEPSGRDESAARPRARRHTGLFPGVA